MSDSKFPIKIPSAKTGDQPASRSMLYAVKKELKAEILASERRVDTRLVGLRGEFAGLKSEFAELRSDVAVLKLDVAVLKSDVAELKSDVAGLKLEFAELKVCVHRTNVLVEEQNHNNRIVLEGLQALWQRQEALERR